MGDPPRSWRDRIFGDRGAARRAGIVMAGLIGLTAYAELAWEYRRPALDRCLAQPARYHDRMIWIGPARVERLEDRGFLARDMRGCLVLVESPPGTVSSGEQVALRGRFLAPDDAVGLPPRVVLDVGGDVPPLRRTPGGREKRYAMYAVSLAVLVVVARRCLRRFRFHGRQIELKPEG